MRIRAEERELAVRGRGTIRKSGLHSKTTLQDNSTPLTKPWKNSGQNPPGATSAALSGITSSDAATSLILYSPATTVWPPRSPFPGMAVRWSLDTRMVSWSFATSLSGGNLRIVTGDGRLISNLWFSPDSLVLASTCCKVPEPNQVTLWNPTTARPFAEIPQVNGHVPYGAFTAEGNRLLLLEHNLNADDQKNMLVFWDLTRGPENPVPGVAPIASSRMAYPSNGRWMATSHVRNMVTLRDTRTGKPITTLSRSFDWISELAASDDGQILAVADLRSITIWDIAANRELGTVALDKPGPLDVFPGRQSACERGFGTDPEHCSDCRRQNALRDRSAGGRRKRPEDCIFTGRENDCDTRNQRHRDHLDTTSGRTLARFGREIGRVGCVAFTPDGETLIVPGADGPISHGKLPHRSSRSPRSRATTTRFGALRILPTARRSSRRQTTIR